MKRSLNPSLRPISALAGLALCTALAGPVNAQSALAIGRVRPVPSDLSYVRVADTVRHLVFRVYFDSTGEGAARRAIPLLADVYTELARRTGASAARVEWAAVAFVAHPDSAPTRLGDEVRWVVPVLRSGALGDDGERVLYRVVPHEQVHAIQRSLAGDLPRWFSEGQATWASVPVTDRLHPALGRVQRAELRDAHGNTPRRLSAWGGVIVRREAVLRQLTPEQRARAEQDSSYQPPGPFSFTPSDFMSDESDLLARYGAAFALFTDLEGERGPAALRAWMRELWREPAALTNARLVETARRRLGVDLAPRLR